MPDHPNSPNWLKTFADLKIELTALEHAAVKAAYENMTQADKSQRGIIPDADFKVNPPTNPMLALEPESKKAGDGDGAAFALDAEAFQILRYHDDTKAEPQWVRFGLQRKAPDSDEFDAFVRLDIYQYPVDQTGVDLAKDAAEVARRLNVLWGGGQRVVALLGAARMSIQGGMELIEPIQKLTKSLKDVAYMTGGYRGESGNCYGVTRAGFDVPKAEKLETLVIMCAAGIADAHQTATAMSIYGQQWGDDTPGLSTASDAAVFFRHIPAGKNYGKWTVVEIANFIHRQKPLAILDPLATASHETHFGVAVPVFKGPEAVAAFLRKALPTGEEVRARKQLLVQAPDEFPPSPPRQESFMAVRLYYDNNEYARWVLQDEKGHAAFVKAGLRFSSQPEAFEGGRDKVLDGYWKDIMLLQHFGKLPQSVADLPQTEKALTQEEGLALAYVEHRKKLEELRKGMSPEQEAQAWWWRQVDAKAIDGIWFLWPAEHDPTWIDALQELPPDPFAQRIAGS